MQGSEAFSGGALAGAGGYRLLGAAWKDNVCSRVEMLIVKLTLSGRTLSGECLFSPGREKSSWKWVMVSCHCVPASLLTLNPRHMGEQSNLAAGDGLVLALSISCPVASVCPVPIMPALSLSSPAMLGVYPVGGRSNGASRSCRRAFVCAVPSPPSCY